MAHQRKQASFTLPMPRFESGCSIEHALLVRRSIRDFTDRLLSVQEVSQLFWAAQGITGSEGQRTAPSAGALYPLELYLVAGTIETLPAGLYKYLPRQHSIVGIDDGDLRRAIASAALDQDCVAESSAIIVIAAVYDRTTAKYGQRGIRHVQMEAGSVAENIYLQAASLGLGTVIVGAFDDWRVRKLLNLPPSEEPLALVPIGQECEHER